MTAMWQHVTTKNKSLQQSAGSRIADVVSGLSAVRWSLAAWLNLMPKKRKLQSKADWEANHAESTSKILLEFVLSLANIIKGL